MKRKQIRKTHPSVFHLDQFILGAAPSSCSSSQLSPPSPERRSIRALLGSLSLPDIWWRFIEEKTGKYSTSSVSKVQLRVLVKKLMVLSEFNVTVSLESTAMLNATGPVH